MSNMTNGNRIAHALSLVPRLSPSDVERSFEAILSGEGDDSTSDPRLRADSAVAAIARQSAKKALAKAFTEIYQPYAETRAAAHVARANARHPELAAPAAPLS